MKSTAKFFALFLAMFMVLSSIRVIAFASEVTAYSVDQEEFPVISTSQKNSNVMTYESVWVNSVETGVFSVYTPNTGTIGITLKVESTDSNAWAFLTVEKPDGTYFRNNIMIAPNTNNGEGLYYNIYNAESGYYKIHYTGSSSSGMRIMCWMY